MAFSPNELDAIDGLLLPWFEGRVPLMVRDQIVLQYRVTRHDVVVFERRPAWRCPGEFVEAPIAKFRFNRRRDTWSVLWRDRHRRWHTFPRMTPTPDLASLIAFVERDPTGIFWG